MNARVKPYSTTDGRLVGYSFHCPGCEETHYVPTEPGFGPGSSLTWGFNGDVAKPTFTPSVLIHEAKWPDGSVGIKRCHFFVRDGRLELLSDCGHAMAGQTIELPEVPS